MLSLLLWLTITAMIEENAEAKKLITAE